jgi:hypothetical protein
MQWMWSKGFAIPFHLLFSFLLLPVWLEFITGILLDFFTIHASREPSDTLMRFRTDPPTTLCGISCMIISAVRLEMFNLSATWSAFSHTIIYRPPST